MAINRKSKQWEETEYCHFSYDCSIWDGLNVKEANYCSIEKEINDCKGKLLKISPIEAYCPKKGYLIYTNGYEQLKF